MLSLGSVHHFAILDRGLRSRPHGAQSSTIGVCISAPCKVSETIDPAHDPLPQQSTRHAEAARSCHGEPAQSCLLAVQIGALMSKNGRPWGDIARLPHAASRIPSPACRVLLAELHGCTTICARCWALYSSPEAMRTNAPLYSFVSDCVLSSAASASPCWLLFVCFQSF